MGELEGKFRSLINPTTLIIGAATGITAAFVNSIQATQKYAASVRDLSVSTGQGAEKASVLLQVLDDYEVTAEDVTTAARAMKEKGLVPTIDTLADLADQFIAIEDPAKRAQFAQDNLGRAYAKYLNVLAQGGDALRRNAQDVNKNLILTDEQIAKTEEYRLQLDNLNDTIEGLKVSHGIGFIEDLNAGLWQLEHAQDIFQEMIRLRKEGMGGAVLGFIDLGDIQAQAEYNIKLREGAEAAGGYEDHYKRLTTATLNHADAVNQDEDAIKAVSEQNTAFLGVLGNVADAQDTYYEGLAAVNQQLAEGKISTEEHLASIGQLAADYKQASADIVLSIVEMKLAQGGWTDAELNAYLEIGLAQGKFTEDQINMAKGAIKSSDDLVAAYSRLEEPIDHVGERAEDTSYDFGLMEMAGYKLAESAYEAAGGVGATKSQLQGLPPSGSAWEYYFNIITKGRVPNFAGLYANTSTTSAALDDLREDTGGGRWAGGPLGSGWTVVGDMPGGAWGPYTELVSPSGYVFDAKTSRKIREAGMLGAGMDYAYYGSDGGSGVISSVRSTSTRSTYTTKTKTGRNARTIARQAEAAGSAGGETGGLIITTPEEDPGEALAGIGNQVASDIEGTVVSAMKSAQLAAASASIASQSILKDINNSVQSLIGKTASATDISRAVHTQESKFS